MKTYSHVSSSNHNERPDRQLLTLADLTTEDIAALEQTRAPDSSKSFDQECP